jgi:hypothetical protein
VPGPQATPDSSVFGPQATDTPTAGPEPQGRLAVNTFQNNIVKIDAANYVWLKTLSNYWPCHKGISAVQPTQALLWIVGDIDSHNLSNAHPYGSWNINIRLAPSTNKALTSLLKTGPYKSYNPPNRYSVLRIKATLKSVLEDLDDEVEYLEDPAEPICIDNPYPFT